jgi:hypothetical protein
MTTKTAAKHTEGPWQRSIWRPYYIIQANHPEPICSLAEFTEDGDSVYVFPKAEANAALIAAAPAMYEALNMWHEHWEARYDGEPMKDYEVKMLALVARLRVEL